MKISDARIEANRRNALLSTGPRTEEGKNRSRLNAIRHGLTGQIVVLPEEELQTYQDFAKAFLAEWKPETATETQLVQTVIDTQWRLNSARAREHSLFALGHFGPEGDIETGDPQIHAALTAARMLLEHSRDLDNLSKHEQRQTRILQSTIKLLRELQEARRLRERVEMTEAVDAYKLHQMQEIPYDPAQDGFVLTVAKIEAHLGLRRRNREAAVAKKLNYDRVAFAQAMAS